MKTLLIVLQLVPALIETIKSIELLVPDGGQGKEKLSLVRNIMTTCYDGVNEIWPVLEKVISSIVATANAVKVFTKKGE